MVFRLFNRSSLPSVYRVFFSNDTKLKKPSERRAAIIFYPSRVRNSFYFLSKRSSETVSFTRPFLRRLANTFRPLGVCMRWRKPCTCFLLRTCGWYVLFLPGIFLSFPFTNIIYKNKLIYSSGHHPCCL